MSTTLTRPTWAGELFVEALFELFHSRGNSSYLGEPVTQTEHALQAAWLAEQDGADSYLVVASLLHDVGHLIRSVPEDYLDQGMNDTHEEVGFRWLVSHFEKDVSEPVRLHVDAKRYLCAVDASYFAKLSEASRMSLALQGGAMTDDEVADFEADPFAEDAVALRRYDDQAKVEGQSTPGLEHFRPHLHSVLGL